MLVTSGAAWAGGVTLGAYGATKAFDLVLAEGLWAEWRTSGVDVLGLVLSATDTPSLQRLLVGHTGSYGELADPDDVARAGTRPPWRRADVDIRERRADRWFTIRITQSP